MPKQCGCMTGGSNDGARAAQQDGPGFQPTPAVMHSTALTQTACAHLVCREERHLQGHWSRPRHISQELFKGSSLACRHGGSRSGDTAAAALAGLRRPARCAACTSCRAAGAGVGSLESESPRWGVEQRHDGGCPCSCQAAQPKVNALRGGEGQRAGRVGETQGQQGARAGRRARIGCGIGVHGRPGVELPSTQAS